MTRYTQIASCRHCDRSCSSAASRMPTCLKGLRLKIVSDEFSSNRTNAKSKQDSEQLVLIRYIIAALLQSVNQCAVYKFHSNCTLKMLTLFLIQTSAPSGKCFTKQTTQQQPRSILEYSYQKS